MKSSRSKCVTLSIVFVALALAALSCGLLFLTGETDEEIPIVARGAYVKKIPEAYTRPELLDEEEREILKDVRTSFVPTEQIVLSPIDISRKRRETFNKLRVFDEELIEYNDKSFVIIGDDELDEKSSSDKHGDEDTQKAADNTDVDNDDDDDSDDVEPSDNDDDKTDGEEYYTEVKPDIIESAKPPAPQKQSIDDGGPFDDVVDHFRNQPELEEGEKMPNPNDIKSPLRVHISGIHSFWKGQGDRETIRATQAGIMRQYMDVDADPCQDFYQYACGNWAHLNPIPADKAGFDTFEMLRENLDSVLKDLLTLKNGDNYHYPGPNLDLDNYLKVVKGTEDAAKGRKLAEQSIEHSLNRNKDVDIAAAVESYLNNKTYERIKRSPIDSKMRKELLDERIKRYLRNYKFDDVKYPSHKKNIQFHKTRSDLEKRKEAIRIYEQGIDEDHLFEDDRHSNEVTYPIDKILFSRRKRDIQVSGKNGFGDKDVLSEETDPAHGDATLKAKFLFKSCLNYDILERRGHQPLIDLLDMLGGWPVLDSKWNVSNFNWLELIARLRLYNNDILISEWVGPDIKNSDEYVIQFDQTSLGLPTRDYFLHQSNKIYLDAYKDYFIKVATLLGAEPQRAKRHAEELIDFETRLAAITSSPEDRRNVSELYNRLPLGRLQNHVPQVDWRRYLAIVRGEEPPEDQTVIMFALKYMENLVSLLEETEPRTVSDYLLWRFVRHRANNLDDRFQEAKQQFYYVLFGREQAPPRWKNCVAQVNSNMGMALGSMFVRNYFDENSKNDTLLMTSEIQQSFREILKLTDWIDEETKDLAAEKVDTMMLRIGYPDYILDKRELDERYREVKIHPDKYFENTLNILQHLTKMEQARLGQLVNKTLWNTAPAVVNAYYSRNKNQIMFPAGILQPPFYHRDFPRSLNYGGIGVVIGHEITHGFDDKGRLFDRDGNLHRWWKDKAIDAFHKRAQCLIDQYSHYTVSEVAMPVDGVNTQGENIADNGGIKQAFRAYQRWLSRHGEEGETLPGLNATHTQLFFLNFAQVWCGAMRPEATRNKLKTAVHSPGKFRVIGTLSNSDDFAKEFQCPRGSPMNPVNKCSVW